MALLNVHQLAVSFRTPEGVFPAVKPISFSLEAGESLAIVGESGSGKSVTMRAIMGLLDPRSVDQISGEAWFEGANEKVNLIQDQDALKSIRGNQIAMIFQEPMTALNPVMRCGKQILEVIQTHLPLSKKESEARLEELLLEVQLSDVKRIIRSYPHELSGGQRQRVMIAMALAANPTLLIADEPTTALDVAVQASILQLLKRIQKERGMALIFISHDLGVVKEIADRTLVMFRGEKIEEGLSTEIFTHPSHIYTRALIACRPSAHKKGQKLPVMRDFFDLDAEGNFIPKSMDESMALPEHQVSEDIQIEVEGLEVEYDEMGLWGPTGKRNQVIKHIAFTIRKGETLGVLGESGSGKSTTGRAIMQLIRYKGTIKMNGELLHPGRLKDRRTLAKKIQLIYQDPYSSLNPKYKIGRGFIEVMKRHGIASTGEERKLRGIALLEKVGLSEEAWEKYPHEFSGGQRQRIAIARALVVEPEFIVCDEAVSALDVSVQAQILNLLKDIQREFGMSYLFITHDLQVVRNIADRVLVLNKGEIAEIKETEALFARPENEYTQKLLASFSEL
ncbi:MAG: dipeptide ABC transporter ATP-binding protein [Bacteroidetes bacterium]|nr:dipeptide ABC transporter ATP-binding protein [Bacteroidota bacterium]